LSNNSIDAGPDHVTFSVHRNVPLPLVDLRVIDEADDSSHNP
jgi:hypothetical protein